MKQSPPSKRSHGLADQQRTLTYNMRHSVNIMLVPLVGSDFCRMCMLFCVAEYVCVIVEEGFVCVLRCRIFFFCVRFKLNVRCSLYYQATKLLPFHIHLPFLESGFNSVPQHLLISPEKHCTYCFQKKKKIRERK